MTVQDGIKLESKELLPYLGENHMLVVLREDRTRGKVKEIMGRILMWVPYDADYEQRKSLLEKWYRRQAEQILAEKTAFYAERLGVSFADIRIKDQRSRWGSCSSKKNLNFNWRIIMAPEPVCDYVVIHEVCHLLHMDHSREFWKEVEGLCPEYRQYKSWLKEKGGLLYPF